MNFHTSSGTNIVLLATLNFRIGNSLAVSYLHVHMYSHAQERYLHLHKRTDSYICIYSYDFSLNQIWHKIILLREVTHEPKFMRVPY